MGLPTPCVLFNSNWQDPHSRRPADCELDSVALTPLYRWRHTGTSSETQSKKEREPRRPPIKDLTAPRSPNAFRGCVSTAVPCPRGHPRRQNIYRNTKFLQKEAPSARLHGASCCGSNSRVCRGSAPPGAPLGTVVVGNSEPRSRPRDRSRPQISQPRSKWGPDPDIHGAQPAGGRPHPALSNFRHRTLRRTASVW